MVERRRSDRIGAGMLSDQMRGRVYAVIEAYCAEPQSAARISATIASLVSGARTNAIPSEHLVVALRNTWDARSAVPRGACDADATKALSQLTDLFLASYYAGMGTSPPPRRSNTNDESALTT